MPGLPTYPFDPELLVGTVTEVTPTSARVNLPHAASPEAQWHHGQRQGRGEVGDFVVIEVGDSAIFGRIVMIRLPEKERLTVEPELGRRREAHPVGTIQLLSTVALHNGEVTGGISRYPRLGSRVYSALTQFVQWIAEASSKAAATEKPIYLDLGSLAAANAAVQLTPERLFGRHCAVLGATGGGKSWTVARLIEQASRFNSKLVLLDATGEFHTLQGAVRHVHIGNGSASPPCSEGVCFPYTQLTENDLFALFKPSGQIQAPKLRLAMKSLRLIRLETKLGSANGLCIKAQQSKKPIMDAEKKHAQELEEPRADFDITKLPEQIMEECVWPSGGTATMPDQSKWGSYQGSEQGFCITLITRLEVMLGSPELAPILKPGLLPPLSDVIDDFLVDNEHRVLRISLKYLSFAHSAREVVANAIGRRLLTLARDRKLSDCPLLVFLDEAHQFLDKSLGDEANRYPLDSFDLIAKEGRKYSLNICIATQRPRDVPDGVLSQMGTLIVHRLVNDRDREVVERASGEIDRSAAEFLPTLAPGQAVIIGVDFPIPLTIQVSKPDAAPDSKGPDFQTSWSREPRPQPKVMAAGRGEFTGHFGITDDDVPF